MAKPVKREGPSWRKGRRTALPPARGVRASEGVQVDGRLVPLELGDCLSNRKSSWEGDLCAGCVMLRLGGLLASVQILGGGASVPEWPFQP